jgi:hypothetical protein
MCKPRTSACTCEHCGVQQESLHDDATTMTHGTAAQPAHGAAWSAAWSAAQARGDTAALLVLAREAPSTALQIEAHCATGEALLQQGNATLARAEIALAAQLAPGDAAIAQRVVQCPSRDCLGELPRRVLLFAGHLVDAPDRAAPRFPPSKVAAAAQRIGAALHALGASPGDVAYSQAAAGGDLLFIEACRARGVHSLVLLPFDEPEFIARSVTSVSEPAQWQARYDNMRQTLGAPVRCMPQVLGPLPPGVNAFERCNEWLLSSALVHGADKLAFIGLWTGGDGDGPGGTGHMVAAVQRRGLRCWWIDTRTL